MSGVKNKTITEFVTSLCRATAKDEMPDAIRKAHKDIVVASLEANTFIPKDLYEVDGDFYKPNRVSLSKWHNYLDSPYSKLVPFNVYSDSIDLGIYVLQDRTNTEERLKLVNSSLEFLIQHNEFITNRPNQIQLKFTNTLGILYNHLVKQSGINFTNEQVALNTLSNLPDTNDHWVVLGEMCRLLREKGDFQEGEIIYNASLQMAWLREYLQEKSSTVQKMYGLDDTTQETQAQASEEE